MYSPYLHKVQKRLQEMTKLPVFLAGGCVRDELYGVIPKDYDAIIPYSGLDLGEVHELMRILSERFARAGIKSSVYQAYDQANSGSLTSFQKMFQGCMKVEFSWGDVDLLFSTFDDIDVHVANHDCNLNQVYLDQDGNIIGERVSELKFIEGISDERKAYMQDKFLALSPQVDLL